MGRHFLLYWNWETVLRELNTPPATLPHAASNQFDKISAGDTLWIVSVPPRASDDAIAGRLMLIGRLLVARCTDDQEEAARWLGSDDLWDARWHALAEKDAVEPYQVIRLDDAAQLRLVGEHDRLTEVAGKINPQQLQSMRELTADSAETLTAVWYAHLIAASGRASFHIPDDVDVSDLPQELLNALLPDDRPDLREHIRCERNPLALLMLTQQLEASEGRIACDICGFDFSATYGPVGAKYIEAHHLLPVEELADRHAIDTDDLLPVCANCHRMLHRGMPQMSVDDLRAILNRDTGLDMDPDRADRFVGPMFLPEPPDNWPTEDEYWGHKPDDLTNDYHLALPIAIQAARDAGALLRAEFLRPGGPSGHGDHAEADTRAEMLIRERLLAATPRWAYYGEETHSGGLAGANHVWLVDPNDGTVSYLQGYRGSAVSIALLRDGVPVLGVVYAYTAPDNEGDLFAWAEGCGGLWRNRQFIDRVAWSPALTTETVVLVSQSADRAPAANLACVAPGRYRAETSIAYRLALVAAGDGEAAVSLNGPVSWDYAAGHALLRAVGGELVDEQGRVVTYTSEGRSRARWLFGGSPAVIRELAQRPWDDIFAQRATSADPLDLVWPKTGQAVSEADLLRRAQGALLGQLAGDALGSMVEFKTATALRHAYPEGLRAIGPSPIWRTLAGQPTDDSELALALARALLNRKGFDAEAVATAYLYWLESHPFDIGGTTRQALGAMQTAKAASTSLVEAAATGANQESEANGALMRQSSLAVWGHALSADALDAIVRADTRLTHPHRVCQDASAAFVVTLAAVVRDGLSGEEAYALAVDWDQRHGASPGVSRALAAARHAPPADYSHHQGHVLIALQNAFYQALHAASFEEGVVATVMGGGDTDTNAAIAGALLGAIYGARAIPSKWRQTVLTCRPQAGASGVHQPRPRAFWPVDALRLAEYLVQTGAAPSRPSGEGGR